MSPCKLDERLNIVALDLIKPNAYSDLTEPSKCHAVFVQYLASAYAFTTIA